MWLAGRCPGTSRPAAGGSKRPRVQFRCPPETETDSKSTLRIDSFYAAPLPIPGCGRNAVHPKPVSGNRDAGIEAHFLNRCVQYTDRHVTRILVCSRAPVSIVRQVR